MCLVKNPSSQNLDFFTFGTKDLSREKCTILGLECRSAEVELQLSGVPHSWNCFAIQLLQSVRSIVKVGCDSEGTFLVGAKLSCSGIFSGFTSDLPHEVAGLKGSWLNLCIVSPGWFQVPPSYFLHFVVAGIVVSLSMVPRLQRRSWHLCHMWVSKDFRWLLFGVNNDTPKVCCRVLLSIDPKTYRI